MRDPSPSPAADQSKSSEWPQPAAQVETLLSALRATYGRRLGEADLDLIKQRLERQAGHAAALAGAPLTNADGPDITYNPS